MEGSVTPGQFLRQSACGSIRLSNQGIGRRQSRHPAIQWQPAYASDQPPLDRYSGYSYIDDETTEKPSVSYASFPTSQFSPLTGLLRLDKMVFDLVLVDGPGAPWRLSRP